jgi:ribose 5-phosphate isomerase
MINNIWVGEKVRLRVVEHGLFIGIADTLIVGNENSVEVISRNI